MSAPEPVQPPRTRSLRVAGVIALTTLFVAGALLYQGNDSSEQPPDFQRGGPFAGDLAQPGDEDITIVTPSAHPAPSGASRSSATLTAPRKKQQKLGDGPPPFPTLGKYVYRVEGSESGSIFGSRTYPPEMTMTVHRSPADDSGDLELEDDEIAFDLVFSQDHEEREIVAYRRGGIAFTFEARSITFGPQTNDSETSYAPPITQIPIPLTEDAGAGGTSRAIRADGTLARTESWTVEVTGRERIEIMNESIDTYVVEIERESKPGSEEPLTRSRKYWFDPVRVIWVKWEEHTSETQDAGFGSFVYETTFTATLDRLEPA